MGTRVNHNMENAADAKLSRQSLLNQLINIVTDIFAMGLVPEINLMMMIVIRFQYRLDECSQM